jgi:hypothetical protein
MAQKSGETKRVFLWIKRKDITDGDDVLYLRRWILAKAFGWKFMLHKIVRADHDRCHHDHPWGFFGFILKGGYTEELPITPGNVEDTQIRVVKPWRFINRMNPLFTHRIRSLLNGPSWTLLISTPVRRGWGFFTPEGWLHWKDFLKVNPLTRVLWCGTDDDE